MEICRTGKGAGAMKRGICVECKDSAKDERSYFCYECLHKEAVERAKTD